MNLNNISFVDIVLLCLKWIYSRTFLILPRFLLFQKLFRNPVNVSISTLKKRYPIKAVLKSGDFLFFKNESMLMSYRERCDKFKYEKDRDLVRIPIFDNTKEIILEGGAWNGEVTSIFADEIYHQLPVKNRTVIDIGSNIGDSAVYFALHGATRVIGIEPFPRNYELSLRNIRLNKLTDIIDVTLAACSDCKGEIKIDPTHHSISSKVEDFDKGVKIRLLTLQDIIVENNIHVNDPLILKMDCEGDEYKIILSADKSILRRFSHIMIEYHDGYKNLEKKLINSGFSVSTKRPRIIPSDHDVSSKKGKYLIGSIYAKRT